MLTTALLSDESVELKLLMASYEELTQDAYRYTPPQIKLISLFLLQQNLEGQDASPRGISCFSAFWQINAHEPLHPEVAEKLLTLLGSRTRWATQELRQIMESMFHQTSSLHARVFDTLLLNSHCRHSLLHVMGYLNQRVLTKPRLRLGLKVFLEEVEDLSTFLKRASGLRMHVADFYSPAALNCFTQVVIELMRQKFGSKDLDTARQYYRAHYWTHEDAHHYVEWCSKALK